VIGQSKFVPYEKKPELHEIPRRIQEKNDRGEILSNQEEQMLNAYMAMEEDLLKEAADRKRGTVYFPQVTSIDLFEMEASLGAIDGGFEEKGLEIDHSPALKNAGMNPAADDGYRLREVDDSPEAGEFMTFGDYEALRELGFDDLRGVTQDGLANHWTAKNRTNEAAELAAISKQPEIQAAKPNGEVFGVNEEVRETQATLTVDDVALEEDAPTMNVDAEHRQLYPASISSPPRPVGANRYSLLTELIESPHPQVPAWANKSPAIFGNSREGIRYTALTGLREAIAQCPTWTDDVDSLASTLESAIFDCVQKQTGSSVFYKSRYWSKVQSVCYGIQHAQVLDKIMKGLYKTPEDVAMDSHGLL
jgi:hypothetical protein